MPSDRPSDHDRRHGDSDHGSTTGQWWARPENEVAEQAFRPDAVPGPPSAEQSVRRPGEVTAGAVLLFISAALRTLSAVSVLLLTPGGVLLVVVRNLGLAAAELYVGRRLRRGATAARYAALVLAAIGLVETGFVVIAGSSFDRFFAVPALAYSIAIVVCVSTPGARAYFRAQP